MRQFILIFTGFFGLDRIFFPNGFANPFRVHSRPSFLFEPNFLFSLVFCSHAVFDIDFLFFKFFLIFLEMVFPIHSESVIGLVFCLVNENSLICTSGLFMLCFFRSLYFLISFYISHDFHV